MSEPAGVEKTSRGPRGDRPVRCLIVDDEPRLRQALVRLMNADGFVCLEAGSGVEALDVLGREPGIALVLSDMRMPFMDGAELLRNVRHRYPDIAVVMITLAVSLVIPVLGG